jgi:microcystin synthetase protein McyJ
LIEVGCGYAASAVYLASHYHPRQICGVDATEVRIREGKARVAAAGLDQVIDLRLGNATALDFPDASFTKALAIECAFHFDTREKFLAEAFRVLTPGGRLAMTDITPARHIRVSDYSREQLREFLTADLKHIGDANIYDQAEYERILRDLGFVDVELESIKDKVGIQFAEHLEKVAAVSPPENQAPRLHFASTFRNQLMVNGDYVVVRARKPG